MHVGAQDKFFGVTFFHVTRLANCESEKAWTPDEELDSEDLKRTTVTPQEGWTVRTSRGPRRRQKMELGSAEFSGDREVAECSNIAEVIVDTTFTFECAAGWL